MRRAFVLAAVALGALFFQSRVHAEEPPPDPRRDAVRVEQPWKVLLRDDPRAADPATDTASWLEVEPYVRWSELESRPADAIAWYRMRFVVLADIPVGVEVWYPFGAAEYYVDGVLLHEQGDFAGRRLGTPGPVHVHVPESSTTDGEIVLAVRMYADFDPSRDGGIGHVRVGPELVIHQRESVAAWKRWKRPRATGQLLVGLATVAIGLLHILLFARRREPALVWFGVGAIGAGGWHAWASAVWMGLVLPGPVWHQLGYSLQSLGWASMFVFGHIFFRFPWPRLTAVPIAVWLVAAVLDAFQLEAGFTARNIAGGLAGGLGLVAMGRAVWARVPGAATVAVGFSVTMLWGLGQLVDRFIVSLPWFMEHLGIIQVAGVLVIPLSISIALANRFTDTLNELDATYRATFRFVPEQFLSILGRKTITEVYRGDNTSLDMTVMFCDIRGFTTLSEGRTPQRNFRFINQFLEVMEPCIHDHGGFVGQYLGDGFLALFPTGSSDPVRAAVEMQHALGPFNTAQVEAGETAIRIGIGLHSGRVMLGTIGGASRLDTGVVSDVVNTASRVEGLSKMYGAPVVVSEATLATLADDHGWTLRELDSVVVKGRKAPPQALEVLDGEPDAADRADKDAHAADYAEALAAFRAGELATAREVFGRLPERFAARELWLQRCDWYLEQGLPEPWDGVVRLTVK